LYSSTILEEKGGNDLDLEENRKVMVIGKVVKEALFGDEPAVGKEIRRGLATMRLQILCS
jgi:hypothetical protein